MIPSQVRRWRVTYEWRGASRITKSPGTIIRDLGQDDGLARTVMEVRTGIEISFTTLAPTKLLARMNAREIAESSRAFREYGLPSDIRISPIREKARVRS